jgi:hypothetical protein
MERVSDKLAALIDYEEPDKEVRLNVLLRRGLDREHVAAVAEEFANLIPKPSHVEVLIASGIILIDGLIGMVPRIAEHPAVEWVDLDTEAPLEELVD